MEVFLKINSGEQEHKGKTSTWSLTMFMEDENQAAKAKTIIANFILEIVYVCRVCKRAKGKTDTMGTAASCVRFFLPYPFWIGKIFNTQSQYNTVQILSDYPCPCSCLVLRYPCLWKEQCCAARFVFNAVVPDPNADSRRTSIDSEERLHYWELARTHYSPDVRAMVAQTVLPWHRIWQPRRYPCLAFKEGPCTT